MATEKRFSSVLTCGHCGNAAPMEIVASYSDITRHRDEATGEPFDTSTTYQILQCPACRAINLRSHFWHEWMDVEEQPDYKLLYPSDIKVPLGLPRDIEMEFRAASKVKAISANAYGVLIGRVLEMVCADRKATGKFLSHRLSDLAKKGEIPHNLVEVANNLARLRNVGAHFDLGQLTPEEVPILEDLCKAILEYVYSAKFLAHKAEEALKKLKTKPSVVKRTDASAA